MNLPLSEPLNYPFGIPEGCFALADGEIFCPPFKCWPSKSGSYATVVQQFSGFEPRVPVERPVGLLACGSNASPLRLAEKLARLGNSTVYGMRLSLVGWVPVYASTIADYGAIPATFEWIDKASAEPFLLMIDASSLSAIEATELRCGNYEMYEVPPVSIGVDVDYPVYAFVARHGALRIGGECFALPDFDPNGSLQKPGQKPILRRVLAEMGSPLGVDEYRLAIRDRDFVVQMRRCIRERFGSRPHVPGWKRLGLSEQPGSAYPSARLTTESDPDTG
jgi:hypothetical protein